MAASIQRIGVLTAGGDCPGLNAVIRAVTKSAIFRYDLEVWGIEDGYLGLIENRMRRLTVEDASNILTLGGTILGSSNEANPARFAVRSGDQIEWRDVTDRVLDHVRSRRLDALICIGGDGTMAGANRLLGHGINCIGVPKTIDNDLVGCELSFGFDTAVRTATEALDRVHTTAMSHHRVMVVEVMGRYAGWLALHAGIASGSDVILLPEIDYDLEKVGDFLLQRSRRKKRFSIVCVSEGAKPMGGERVVKRIVQTSVDPVRLGGLAYKLQHDIHESTGLEARAVVLGHIQRGGSPTPTDRVLSTAYGYHALELLMAGERGKVVVLKDGRITHIDIDVMAGKHRTVPLDHPLIATARAVGTSMGD